MGLGFTLSGFSVITRTKAVKCIDGYNGAITFTDSDRLAIDGQRLIATQGDYWGSGSVYNTEIQSWMKVVAGDSLLSGFTVHMRNGETWSYGTTPDSLIDPNNNVRVWALAAIEDLRGNRIEFKYSGDPLNTGTPSGNYYPIQILYTINKNRGISAQRMVTFAYQPRPDVVTTYVAGTPVTDRYLLEGISTHVVTQQRPSRVKAYSFQYDSSTVSGYSRLTSINIKGTDDNTILPITFSWSGSGPLTFSDPTNQCTLPQGIDVVSTLSADVNGDAKTELVQIWKNPQNNYFAGILAHSKSWSGEDQFTPQSPSSLGVFLDAPTILIADVN